MASGGNVHIVEKDVRRACLASEPCGQRTEPLHDSFAAQPSHRDPLPHARFAAASILASVVLPIPVEA